MIVARILYWLHRYEASIEFLDKVLVIDPTYKEALLVKGT